MISSERVLDLTTLSQSSALPRVIRIARERRSSDYHLRPAAWSWEQATVQVTLDGCGAAWTDGGGQSRTIPRGMALLYHNRSQRDLLYGLPTRDTSWDFLYINLLGSAATAMIGEIAARTGCVVPVDAQTPLWRELLTLLPPPGRPVHRVWSLAQSTALAQRVLLAVSAGCGGEPEEVGSGDDTHLVRRAMRWVEQRLGERWTVARLARDLGVSREHLTRCFATATGMPPAAWLRRERVAAAARLLRGGDSIAAVAKACGFPDAAHFAAVFRAHTGQRPSETRRRPPG